MATVEGSGVTEAELLENVRETCKTLQIAVYHTYRSDRSEAGFPDLTLVGSEGVMFRELKTAKGKVTPLQDWWLGILTAAGSDAGVWRPVDWPQRIIAELRTLGRAPEPPAPTATEVRARLARRHAKLRRGDFE